MDGGVPAMNGGVSITSRVQASGESELLFTPRIKNGTGVIYAHGAGGLYDQGQSRPKGLYRLTQRLARLGYVVVSPDLGGAQNWGNDLSATRMEEARQELIALGCRPQVVLIGASMGNLTIMRYMADQPANVLCGVGLIPAIDIEQIRAENWSGLKTSVEAAWSIDTVAPIPARGVPQGRVEEMTSIPWAAWYGTADSVVTAADISEMVTALGDDSQGVAYNTTLDHSDPLMNLIPYDDVVAWISAVT